MRIVAVDIEGGNRSFIVPCAHCGETITSKQERVADLDGEAYRAYYHSPQCDPRNFTATPAVADHKGE